MIMNMIKYIKYYIYLFLIKIGRFHWIIYLGRDVGFMWFNIAIINVRYGNEDRSTRVLSDITDVPYVDYLTTDIIRNIKITRVREDICKFRVFIDKIEKYYFYKTIKYGILQKILFFFFIRNIEWVITNRYRRLGIIIDNSIIVSIRNSNYNNVNIIPRKLNKHIKYKYFDKGDIYIKADHL